MIDWLGRGVVLKDLGAQDSTASQIFHWVFATPWYVPAGLAALATTAAIYFLLRADRSGSKAVDAVLPDKKWSAAPEQVYRKRYLNEKVDLDGHAFIECTFDHVTLVCEGTSLFSFMKCTFVEGTIKFESHSQSVGVAWSLFNELGMLKQPVTMEIIKGGFSKP